MLVALLLSLALQAATPETPPPTEIFLASLERSTDGIGVGGSLNITNNPGYDNQPFFLPDGSILFTSNRGGKQTDVYQYSPASRAVTRLTATAESEYSPTQTPDGSSVSVIRVEADGTQRLWRFPLEGGEPALVLADVKPVGYHAWADPDTLVLFVLGDPPTLRIAHVRTGRADVLAERPGRCIARMRDGRVSFVQKGAAKDPWTIVALDPRTRAMTPIVETLPGSEDYAWLPDGRLLMGSGSKLFVWNPTSAAAGWKEVADLAPVLRKITRLAVSADAARLAITAEPVVTARP